MRDSGSGHFLYKVFAAASMFDIQPVPQSGESDRLDIRFRPPLSSSVAVGMWTFLGA